MNISPSIPGNPNDIDAAEARAWLDPDSQDFPTNLDLASVLQVVINTTADTNHGHLSIADAQKHLDALAHSDCGDFDPVDDPHIFWDACKEVIAST